LWHTNLNPAHGQDSTDDTRRPKAKTVEAYGIPVDCRPRRAASILDCLL